MKDWKPAYRIAFINCIVVIFAAILFILSNNGRDLGIVLGIVCLVGGIIDLLISIVFFIMGSKEWGKGFLLSVGILFLLSGFSCGAGLSNITYH